MKGLTFIVVGELSEKAKAKLAKLIADRDKKIAELKAKYGSIV